MEKAKITEACIANTCDWLRYTTDELANCGNAVKADVEEILKKLSSYNAPKDGLSGLVAIIYCLENSIERDIRNLDQILKIARKRGYEVLDRIEYKQSH